MLIHLMAWTRVPHFNLRIAHTGVPHFNLRRAHTGVPRVNHSHGTRRSATC